MTRSLLLLSARGSPTTTLLAASNFDTRVCPGIYIYAHTHTHTYTYTRGVHLQVIDLLYTDILGRNANRDNKLHGMYLSM